MAKKVLIAASNYWTSPFQVGSHHYARMFAKNGWEVLFISDPISPFHFLKRDNSTNIERYKIYKGAVESNVNGVKIYVPMSLITPNNKPFFNIKSVSDSWHKLTFPDVLKQIKDKGFGKVDLLWIDSLIQAHLIDSIDYKKSIFRVCDKFEAFSNLSKNTIAKEKILKEKADIIIYSALSLKTYLKGFEEKIFYVPNGVSIENFVNRDMQIPEELKYIKKPVAIYAGSITEWFDETFLLNVVRKCRNISFVIIGQTERIKARFEKENNIYFLGTKKYSEVPDYIYNSDAGIIFFKSAHPLIDTVNPIKLYEYMICGKPVVSTSWEELKLINSPAYLAENEEDFIVKLQIAVSEKEKNKDMYINFAKEHSWERSFCKVLEILNK